MSEAFRVLDVSISAEQRDAGIAVMVGMFYNHDVAGALSRAGVPRETMLDVPAFRRPVAASYVCQEAANRLLQSERKRGNIRFANKVWQRTDTLRTALPKDTARD